MRTCQFILFQFEVSKEVSADSFFPQIPFPCFWKFVLQLHCWAPFNTQVFFTVVMRVIFDMYKEHKLTSERQGHLMKS